MAAGPGPTQAAAQTAAAMRAAITARRRTIGASLGALPVANLVVIEVGLAVGLIVLAVGRTMMMVYAGGLILVIALIIALLRWSGRWFTQWVQLTLRYMFRSHTRTVEPVPTADETATPEAQAVLGPEDARVNLLRLVVPDLVVAQGMDHERRQVGIAWHDGSWTAVLLVEPTPGLIAQVGATPNLPLGALAPCLEDRGVVLDAIQVIWHCYPGSAALPVTSPALASYLEVLGPLPAAARRTTWIAVRLDPRRCPAAISERGGGVVGAHRALIGALSRVRSALEARGVPTRPLDPDELLRSGVSAAELVGASRANIRVAMNERWTGVTTAGIGHASYAITHWPRGKNMTSINGLTGIRALSSTVAMSISPSGEDGQVGLRGLVRVSARTPGELQDAHQRLHGMANRLNVSLTPLRGLQVAGLAATLPLGGAA
jgi:type VII secretion protein EccE